MKTLELLLTGTLLMTSIELNDAIGQYEKPAQNQESNNITLNIAKQNPNQRSRYLTQLIATLEVPSNVKSIIYSTKEPNQGFNKESVASMETKVKLDNKGKNICDIIISKYVFENYNEEEIISELVDHEFYHARQADGIFDFKQLSAQEYKKALPELIKILTNNNLTAENYEKSKLIIEIQAYENQIREFSKHPLLREEFKKDIIKSYNAYANAIKKQPNTPLFKYLKRIYKKK